MNKQPCDVLVVDDNTDNLMVLEGVLSKAGHRVRAATNGPQALKMIAASAPDMILLDIRMPDMSGFEVCQHLKSNVATKDIPVLFISATGDSEDKLHAFVAGAVDFITKPFQADEILARVTTHVTLYSMRRELEKANARLEDRVQERTQELVATNERLWIEISERQQAEATLAESEQRLQFVLQGGQLGFWDWNIVTGEVKRNNQWAILLGYDGETSPNMEQWFDLVHPDDRNAAWQSIQDHLQQRTTMHKCNYRMRTKMGEYRWILDQARVVAWDSSGQAIRMSGTIKDLHERKEAEEALRQSDERFKYAMDATQDGLWDWDITTNETYFSPGYYRMLGYELDTFPMTVDEWRRHAHPEDIECVRRAVQDCKENRIRNIELEIRLQAANGEWRTILSRGRVVKRDALGNALRLVGTHADITERKKLKEQLLQSQKMEAIGTLAGGIAHEFNNILAGIITLTEIVKMDTTSDSPMFDDLDCILKLGLRGRDVVRQILSYSRKNKIEHKPVDLETVFKDTVRLVRAAISPNIEIRESFDADTGRIVGDATQIQQVLMNLANNAVQAMKMDGGVLELQVEATNLNAEQVRTHPGLSPGKYVRITVRDTGIGMDDVTMTRIFDPFFTTKPIGEGTGLGLSIVHGIIESHQGTISVSSAKETGTTFTILLPQIDSIHVDEQAPKPLLPRGTERILLVDDEEYNVFPVAKSLESLGYRVTGTTDSTQALVWFLQSPDMYDLVISDLAMPKLMGAHLAAKLVEIRPDLPVIIATGRELPTDEHDSAPKLPAALINKPYSLQNLAVTIRQTLDAQRESRHHVSH